MPKGNKRFTTYLNNLLSLGAIGTIRQPRGTLILYPVPTLRNMNADLQKWRNRISLTRVDRKYWGQK